MIRAAGDGGAACRDADIDLVERYRPFAEPVGQVDPRCLPPTLVQMMFLMVWWVNPLEEKSSGAARLEGVAAIALAAQVATHLEAVR